ncbi:mammalian cell entry protein [Mycobacterium sp. GA-1999]|nr:mammalian cell entry protein [Mycobacterium sp. GA-0227b]KUH85974.1 mammalian cell entry protein [Mycobacterium sp. GA-1999]KUH87766.1 mammalian cell entry protein [Mycobacterium sp. IS-1556]
MPDTVGLYVDNPVTQMGYQIGKVTAVTPEMLHVRVDFTVNEHRLLPDDVKAVIRSTSILADRSLELVGNYEAGPQLPAGTCIPLDKSFTPKSLSEIIGSATEFINSINPDGSSNMGDVVRGIDEALHNQGADINRLVTTASALLDSPDQAIGDIGSIVVNLAQLTSTLADIEPMVKEVLSGAVIALPGTAQAVWGGDKIFEGLIPLLTMVSDLEKELGAESQQTLDAVATVLRKLTPRAPFYASILNPVPRFINTTINIVNNHQFGTLRYRPPLYRVRTPDGVLTCNIMNASMPGSCANVQGTPYAVDVALLQYVLTEASR